MSTQCNRFVQNAWKKELCSNCFKPREEHATVDDVLRLNVEKASTNLRIDHLQLQSILRGKTACRKDQRKKNVGFLESLTEIIGYGGDDFSDEEEDKDNTQVDSSIKSEDLVPDSEEERALFDLTRTNTNFNTITANLTDLQSNPLNDTTKSTATTSSAKSFASLMLGRIQRDADGRKTTLLVSVTPFGGDESIPAAKRLIDRKINANNLQTSPFKCKSNEEGPSDNTTETTKKLNGTDRKRIDEQEEKSLPELEKIIDLPLITSSNMISVMRKENPIIAANTENMTEMTTQKYPAICKADKKNNTKISLNDVSTVKKTKSSSKIVSQSASNNANDIKDSDSARQMAARANENLKHEKIEIVSASLKDVESLESDHTMRVNDRNINDIDNKLISPRICKVERIRQDAIEKTFCFESSRELAGEPDGKADEEEISEPSPPALPTSPPPIISTEPRSSFLHGNINIDIKPKPIVPQKSFTFFTKTSVNGDASLTTRKILNSDYVLPPPSIQNVANKSIQNLGAQEIICQHLTKENVSNEILLEADRTSSIYNLESESQTKSSSKLVVSSSSVNAQLALSDLSRNYPMENGETDDNIAPDEEFPEVTPVSISTMELVRSPNKRRIAPRPPETTEDLPASSLFARNPGANLKSDSPVVREKEKRERSSSCSPKFRKAIVCGVPDPTNTSDKQLIESTIPRRTISLSQDSLTIEKIEVREEKKRGRNRRGFSLKRFLRMGTRKDMDVLNNQTGTKIDEIPSTPQPKPRLEIIHPLELDGAAVEVVGNDRIVSGRIGEDQTDTCVMKNDGSKMLPPLTTRPGKPPPPPRNQSLEDWSRVDMNKPVRPPPPRAEIKLNAASPRHDKMLSKTTWRPTATTTSDSIYANLAAEDVTGEVRSALAPSKPQRTASMRDQTVSQPVTRTRDVLAEDHRQDYEGELTTTIRTTADSPTSNDSHVYECLSSSSECDSNLELRCASGSKNGGEFRIACKRKSDSSTIESNTETKFHHQPFVRSTSLPYCGNETESELYAPYTFYTSDEGIEEDHDWKNRDNEPKISRLKQRRGRTIVHRSLEDNYGAVVVANHEALAQFLEQENQPIQLPLGLRTLKNTNPSLKQFSIDIAALVSIGRRIFCPATWHDQNVTLCITFDLAVPMPQRDFYLASIIEFVDKVPKEITDKVQLSGDENAEATISILPHLHVTTVQAFGMTWKDTNNESANREPLFVLLQLVNALKSLQARGIEDANKSLNDVVLCREDKDVYYRLYLLQRKLNIDPSDELGEERVSLCECALMALQQLHLMNELPLIQDLLIREKAVTLSQVKSVLEFSLWGPVDVPLGGGPREKEIALQRWLDLERANVLHALVKTKTALTVIDEYQLLFLVRTTAKIMNEASMLLDEQRDRLRRENTNILSCTARKLCEHLSFDKEKMYTQLTNTKKNIRNNKIYNTNVLK